MTAERKASFGLAAGAAGFVLLLLLPTPEGMSPVAQRTAATAFLMAVWWLTEAVDIAVTALLPIALFPVLGILTAREVSAPYATHIVFLYMGGFIVAMSMERCNLHRRIALGVIGRIGTKPSRLALGFMVATAFLSMWISNTATTMMMLPIAVAVVDQLAGLARVEGMEGQDVTERVRRALGVILLLGIAYSASIGGVGTIIGSPTNVAFLGYLATAFPDKPQISFVEWSLLCVPIVIVYLPIAWVYLCRFAGDIPLTKIRFTGSSDVIASERSTLGPMRREERTVAAVAVTTALLWITRSPVRLGDLTVPGWSQLFPASYGIEDSTVAMIMAGLLFVLPSGKPGGRLMDWRTVARGMPWGVVFLFGGGFALAAAIEGSGLADWIGSQMGGLRGVPLWVLVPLSCLLAVLLTETTSNVATVLMMSPVIGATAIEIGVEPYLLLLPTAIMASFAFMLPVATPPNAIVFSSGWISMAQMFRNGLALDMIALLIVPGMVYAIGSVVLSSFY